MIKHFSFKAMLMLILCWLFIGMRSFSQTLLPPDQPEQDACHALNLCGGMFFTPYSYQGQGIVNDLPATPCGPGEGNSMWIRVTIATGGLLVFNIVPSDTLDDYDFAVLDATDADCNHLSPANVVRCNLNSNFPGSNPKGIVGLSVNSSLLSVEIGNFGDPFCAAINALAGQTYLIMVNNFGHDSLPGPSKGFTIDFSGSTATFENTNPVPALGTVLKQCSDSSLAIGLTTPVLCTSVAADGSDFYITPFVSIGSAAGMNCVSGNGYTQQVNIRFTGHAAAGNYVLHARDGTDGNTVLGFCDDSLLLPASLPFLVASPVRDDFLPADTVKCFYSTISVGARREFEQYQWSTGQTTSAIQVINSGSYRLMVTDSNTCTGLDSINIRDSVCPQFLSVPAAFSPNGDGKNDLFRPRFAGAVTDFKFVIYDRWGRSVFETNNPAQGWDGSSRGRPQPAGVYVWMCMYHLYQQPEQIQKGTVVLIR
jgi:gliding motility-associated-like protein